MQGDEQVATRARAPSAAAAPRSRNRSSSATRVSIIVLPTNCIRARRRPRRAGSRSPRRECRKSSADEVVGDDPVDLLGHRRGRSSAGPDSTWATGIPSFAPRRAPRASVELTSPGTSTRSGRSARSTGSSRSSTRAVCSRVAARSRPRAGGRARARRAPRRRPPTSAGRSAGRCGRCIAGQSPKRSRSAAITGAILTKFGRVPTTWTIRIGRSAELRRSAARARSRSRSGRRPSGS